MPTLPFRYGLTLAFLGPRTPPRVKVPSETNIDTTTDTTNSTKAFDNATLAFSLHDGNHKIQPHRIQKQPLYLPRMDDNVTSFYNNASTETGVMVDYLPSLKNDHTNMKRVDNGSPNIHASPVFPVKTIPFSFKFSLNGIIGIFDAGVKVYDSQNEQNAQISYEGGIRRNAEIHVQFNYSMAFDALLRETSMEWNEQNDLEEEVVTDSVKASVENSAKKNAKWSVNERDKEFVNESAYQVNKENNVVNDTAMLFQKRESTIHNLHNAYQPSLTHYRTDVKSAESLGSHGGSNIHASPVFPVKTIPFSFKFSLNGIIGIFDAGVKVYDSQNEQNAQISYEGGIHRNAELHVQFNYSMAFDALLRETSMEWDEQNELEEEVVTDSVKASVQDSVNENAKCSANEKVQEIANESAYEVDEEHSLVNETAQLFQQRESTIHNLHNEYNLLNVSSEKAPLYDIQAINKIEENLNAEECVKESVKGNANERVKESVNETTSRVDEEDEVVNGTIQMFQERESMVNNEHNLHTTNNLNNVSLEGATLYDIQTINNITYINSINGFKIIEGINGINCINSMNCIKGIKTSSEVISIMASLGQEPLFIMGCVFAFVVMAFVWISWKVGRMAFGVGRKRDSKTTQTDDTTSTKAATAAADAIPSEIDLIKESDCSIERKIKKQGPLEQMHHDQSIHETPHQHLSVMSASIQNLKEFYHQEKGPELPRPTLSFSSASSSTESDHNLDEYENVDDSSASPRHWHEDYRSHLTPRNKSNGIIDIENSIVFSKEDDVTRSLFSPIPTQGIEKTSNSTSKNGNCGNKKASLDAPRVKSDSNVFDATPNEKSSISRLARQDRVKQQHQIKSKSGPTSCATIKIIPTRSATMSPPSSVSLLQLSNHIESSSTPFMKPLNKSACLPEHISELARQLKGPSPKPPQAQRKSTGADELSGNICIQSVNNDEHDKLSVSHPSGNFVHSVSPGHPNLTIGDKCESKRNHEHANAFVSRIRGPVPVSTTKVPSLSDRKGKMRSAQTAKRRQRSL